MHVGQQIGGAGPSFATATAGGRGVQVGQQIGGAGPSFVAVIAGGRGVQVGQQIGGAGPSFTTATAGGRGVQVGQQIGGAGPSFLAATAELMCTSRAASGIGVVDAHTIPADKVRVAHQRVALVISSPRFLV